jgi:hypothetical protein
MLLADLPDPDRIATDLFGGVTGWAFDNVTDGITKWVLGAVDFFISGAVDALRTSARPNLTSAWFAGPGSPLATVRNLAGVLLCAFLFLGLIQGLIAGDPAGMVRRVVGGLPGAVAGMVLGSLVVDKLLELTDALSDAVMVNTDDRALHFLSGFSAATTATSSNFAVVVIALVAVMAAGLLWIELIVRSVLVYLLVAISPLAFAATLWPSARGFLRKTVELLLAVILSKFAICIALSVGVAALSGAGSSADGHGTVPGLETSIGTLLAGTAIVGLAAFSPFIILRLIPVAEAAVTAQGISRAPARSAQTGLSTAYSTSMLTRLAGGNARSGGTSGSQPRLASSAAAEGEVGSAAGGSSTSAAGASAGAGAAGVVAAGAGAAFQAAKRAGRKAQASADAASRREDHSSRQQDRESDVHE